MASSYPQSSNKDDGQDDEDASYSPIEEALGAVATPPVHPIPSMQAAFDESIMDAHDESTQQVRVTLDAAARRLQLLELENYRDEYSSRWRQKPGSRFHPLFKLVAQVSFGVHLLHQRLAKSDEEVVRILQTHIDDIDGFIEDSQADFDLAIRDVNDRLKYLHMPLEHGEEFDRMLDNRDFRTAIIEGNDIIERIIHRTARAMKHASKDVKKGLEATAEFAKYLDRIGDGWTEGNEDLQTIYNAMRGNAEGWYQCFGKILHRGRRLGHQLEKLDGTVNEVARRAGIASRRNATQAHVRRTGLRTHSRTPQSSGSGDSPPSVLDKPLPPDPTMQHSRTVKSLRRSATNHAAMSAGQPPANITPSASRQPANFQPMNNQSTNGRQEHSRPTTSQSASSQPTGAPSRDLRAHHRQNSGSGSGSRNFPPTRPPRPPSNGLGIRFELEAPIQGGRPDVPEIKLTDTSIILPPPPPIPTIAERKPPTPVQSPVELPSGPMSPISGGRRPLPSPIVGDIKPSTSLTSHPPDLDLVKLQERLRMPKLNTAAVSPTSSRSIETNSATSVKSRQEMTPTRTFLRDPSPASPTPVIERAELEASIDHRLEQSTISSTRSSTPKGSAPTTSQQEQRQAEEQHPQIRESADTSRSAPATIDSAYSSGSDAAALPVRQHPPREASKANLTLFPSQDSHMSSKTTGRIEYDEIDDDSSEELTALPLATSQSLNTNMNMNSRSKRGHNMHKKSLASLRDMFAKKQPVRHIAGSDGLGGHVPI